MKPLFLIVILSLIFSTGCNEAFVQAPVIEGAEGAQRSSTVVFVINPRAGYWTFSDRPGLMYVAATTRVVTGTITATVHPNDPNTARFGGWTQAPGPTNGDTITITANGVGQIVTAVLAPAGNG